MIQHHTTIDGKQFTVSMLMARRSLKVLRRLLSRFAPALSLIGAKGAMDEGALGKSARELFENLSDEDLDFFINELLQTALCEGKPCHAMLDTLFQTNPNGLLELLIFSARVNFSPFFSAFKGRLNEAFQAKA